MGRRKNNNPQKAGTRGPGRKSRKQEAPDAMNDDNGDGISLGVHNGGSPSKSPPTRSSDRGAKLRAQSLFTKNQGGAGVAALARKTQKLALTPPQVIVAPHEGEPLKSALKHTPSPKGTVSSTISKLERQRSNSAARKTSSPSGQVAERKVKFSEAPEVREMTLSETEEDRQPLASTLLSILNSCIDAEVGEPPARKRRKKKVTLSTKKGPKGSNGKPKAAAAGMNAGTAESKDDAEEDEDDDDGVEIDVPARTPIDLLHALVDMANAQQTGSAENDDDDEDEVDGNESASKQGLPNALLEFILKQGNVSPMKSKKARKSDPVDDDATDGPSVLLNDADVDEIEKLNEQSVAAATGSPSKSEAQRKSRSSSSSALNKSTELAVLLSDTAIDDDDTTTDEDFEPTAADFEQARQDALWKPGDDDDTMEGVVADDDADAVEEDAAPSKESHKDSAAKSANTPSSGKNRASQIRPLKSVKATPVKNTDAAEAVNDESMPEESGEKSTSASTMAPSSTLPKTSSPIKGRRSINAVTEQQPQQNSDDAGDEPSASSATVTAPEKVDDLVLSTTQGAGSSRPARSTVLPQTSSQDDKMNRVPEQLAIVESRMHETIQTLATFDQYQKAQNDAGQTPRPRAHFVGQLIEDLCTYYSYNEFLMRKLVDLFQFGELVEFCEANEAPRPVTIRVNSLKARRRTLAEALIQRGVNLDPIPGDWTKVGLVIFDSKVPIGATPEYLAGHYMLQGASSLLPVMALAPKPGESILDMCAAPGGKSTHIAAVMKNTGMLVANDANPKRCKAIVANMSRMGVVNAVVSSVDGKKLPEAQQKYHRVLLDAPCSGTGVLARDPSAKMSKNEQDMLKITTLQKELILAAIRCLKPDGVLVYSTCSVLVEENESVVQYALNKCAGLKLVETGLTFGVDGFKRFREHRFDEHMSYTKRFYPHQHNMDGFFVAKMRLCGPAKFDSDVNKAAAAAATSSRSTLPEFVAQQRQFRGGSHAENDDDDVEMADGDDDDDEDDGAGRNMRSGKRNRPVTKFALNLAATTNKRRALREGARDRKKRKLSQNQRGTSAGGSNSITGDKQREQKRSGQPATSSQKSAGNNGSHDTGAATGSVNSATPKKNLPNGVSHAPKTATPIKPTTTEATKSNSAQATRKEPVPLFQRVKDRAGMKRRSDAAKPVGVVGMRLKKKPLTTLNDAGVSASAVNEKGAAGLAAKGSRKIIGKKRF